MAKTQCIATPNAKDGKPSKMYRDLINKIKLPRTTANLFYAALTLPQVDAAMERMFTKDARNEQEEWKAEDVMKFFDGYTLMNNMATSTLEFEKAIGAKDANGNYIDFTDSEEALDKALNANSSNEISSNFGVNKTVSFVVRKGDKFNIITEQLNSKTLNKILETQKEQQKWDVVDQGFQDVGIDLRAFDFYPEFINAINGKNIAYWASSVPTRRNDLFTEKELRTILSMSANTQQVDRLKQIFGSMEEVARKVYEAYQTRGRSVASGQMSLIDAAVDEAKKLRGVNGAQMYQDVLSIENDVPAGSLEVEVADKLAELNTNYDLDADLHFIDFKKNIRSLSEAAENAIFTLKRQIQMLKTAEGVTQDVLDLQNTLDNLAREIKNKRYYVGILGFLNEAGTQVQKINDLITTAQQATGTRFEQSITRSNALMEARNLKEGYFRILNALTDLDKIIVDESINSIDKNTIETQSKALIEVFDKVNKNMDSLVEETMIDIITEYLGDKADNGEPIANLVHMAKADSTAWDHFYSVGRVSNPIMGVMGKVIRDAQGKRTAKLAEISRRIRRATNILHKSGSNSSFIYEKIDWKGFKERKKQEVERLKASGLKGKDLRKAVAEWIDAHSDELTRYIISDIDWQSFNKAKLAEKKRLIDSGYKGLALKQALDDWVEDHTEERVVDYTNGRTERVPDSNYRKAFPTLTDAQMQYYNTMMQIKGEIGSLLPFYAQKQYLPPQKRRTMVDALGASKGNPKKIAKALLNKFKDYFVVREDDTDFSKNGVLLNGEEWDIAHSDMDGTKLKEIPIFYMNRLKDQEELVTDFSGALQSLAGTAINYECMNEIKNTVEMMGDFLKKQEIDEKGVNGRSMVDMVATQGVKFFKRIRREAQQTNTSALVDAFIDQHLYGVKMQDTKKWTKAALSIIGYTSVRSLAINVKGAIANYLVGEMQMLIEAGCGEFYNPMDWEWAHRKVFGDNTYNAPGRIMDFITNNQNSKAALLAEIFDPLNESFGELSSSRYHKSGFRKLISYDPTFAGYGMGEHMIHFVNMYAVLKNVKVRIGGEEKNSKKIGLSYYRKYSLYDAFEKVNKIDGNSELKLKDNVEYWDKEEEVWKAVDQEFIDKIRDRIRYCNQTTHGSMNAEDRGVISQKLYGRLIMNLRQWMVEHYSRRYRARYWDASLGQWREGYYNTVAKLLTSWASDRFKFETDVALHWKDMDRGQKKNVIRAMAEVALFCSLLGLSFALGAPEDHRREYWYRMWIYQTKRAILEVGGSTPVGIPKEMDTLINSPIAATNTVNSLLYPFVHLDHLNQKVKGGRHRGRNKWVRNMEKYWLPFYNQAEQMYYFGEDEGVFSVFKDKYD